MAKVYVVGVGMIKFEKPGKRNWDYPEMGARAARKALIDAGINYGEIKQAVVGYVYGDSTCGQRAVYEVGLSGIPIYNVNNNCSTGASALFLAKQLVEGGISDCVLALGFDKMQAGSLKMTSEDRTAPLDRHVSTMMEHRGFEPRRPPAAQMFGNAGREHMEKYGSTPDHFAKIAEKNHRHSARNPYSQFREIYTLDEIKAAPAVFEPLTKLQCCPTSDGAAAAVVCSEAFVRKHNLMSQAVEVAAMAMATDFESSFKDSMIKMVGADMTASATRQVLAKAGVTVNDVQVIELHDCFSANELVTYEALGLCGEGQAASLIDNNQCTYGGKWVVNPSGGLISKGHPLGATGLAQCAELCWQLRGMCGDRQVPNCTLALQHNLGLGGAAVVALYRLGFPSQVVPFNKAFNPAISAREPDEPVAKL